MSEKIRTLYNRIQYAALRAASTFASAPRQFFPDANGWGITYRSGAWVYKRWSLPFLFHTPSFSGFIAFHRALRARAITRYLPEYEVSTRYVRYAYIPGAMNLVEALALALSPQRIALVSEAMRMTDYFHAHGVTHGDLKPKNILVKDARLYGLDFENARIDDAPDREGDYRKLFPRIAYFCTEAELRQSLDAADASSEMRAYFDTRFFARPDIRAALNPVRGLAFEAARTPDGEDLDVSVPDARGLAEVLAALAQAELDYRLFYYARNDVKVFVYNAAVMHEIDVHLDHPLSARAFRAERLTRHPAAQIAFIGPDGVGKTTLIEKLMNERGDAHLDRLRATTIHAWRFSRGEHESAWSARADRRTGGIASRIPAYARFLRRDTHPLIYLDRSFYDPFLRASAAAFRSLFIFKPFFPRDIRIILLVASTEAVLQRKAELSAADIDTYYARASRALPSHFAIPARDPETTYDLTRSLVRYLVLTDLRYLYLPGRNSSASVSR